MTYLLTLVIWGHVFVLDSGLTDCEIYEVEAPLYCVKDVQA
ncbi:hypothetical protein [Mesorhizobium sp. STM 4661]|nr:hypothetical protein [Mesorhizobium sp. STM 4661]CCV12962.1 hypothetical protein MESS4_510129 [Mesorhizobium sp. STM 4661]